MVVMMMMMKKEEEEEKRKRQIRYPHPNLWSGHWALQGWLKGENPHLHSQGLQGSTCKGPGADW